ncbi:MAG: hypothetical protein FWD57_04885, partial [Polyangiaceae bacterium]|nr:hypothetical protein [Polyangiaceae bacterium]
MLRSGRVHHAMRFEGPHGIGKEMAAMAFAQALVCTEGGTSGSTSGSTSGNALGCG